MWAQELRGFEVWKMAGTRVVSCKPWLAQPAKISELGISLDIPPNIDADTLNLARQVDFNLKNLAVSSAQYAPEILPDLTAFIDDIQQVLLEIAFLENPKEASSTRRFSKTHIDQINRSPGDRIAQLNHRIDLLVQFNSSLSYVVSQGFHGGVPILTNRSLVADHSLLGIGTAWRALSRFAHYVNVVLDECPVTAVVREDYKGRTPISLDDEQEWAKSTNHDIDTHLRRHPKSRGLPKLAFFSSRLGFGETYYNVTAAAQTLHAGDTPRRSLMTLSHEMMHAHVSGLLASIFCEDNSSKLTLQHFDELLLEWRDWAARISPNDCFLRELRCWLIENRMQDQHHASELGEQKERISPANAEQLMAFWRSKFRFLNEVIVHTLDFHYFYNESAETYLDSIWESWMTVPGVVDEPLEYILRSLIAIGSSIEGPVWTVLGAASRTLEVCLERLIAKHGSSAFLVISLDLLRSKEVSVWLEFNFPLNFSLAKVVRKFLRSSKIQALLATNDEENLRSSQEDEESLLGAPLDVYDLNTGDFTGVSVNNPVAFLRDRLWRSVAPESSKFPEEYRTAWVFLVLSGAKCEIKQPSA